MLRILHVTNAYCQTQKLPSRPTYNQAYVCSDIVSQGVLKLTKAEKDQRMEAAVSASMSQVVAFERQLYGKRILCAEDMFDALDRDNSGACAVEYHGSFSDGISAPVLASAGCGFT